MTPCTPTRSARAAAARQFTGITLTGVDAGTLPADALALLARGQVELGLLYAPDAVGPRYVSLDTVRRLIDATAGPLALHVCGPRARAQLLAGRLDDLLPRLARVQINGRIGASELFALAARVSWLITQHAPGNEALCDLPVPRHGLLVDGSGGLGLLPPCWRRPATAKAVGFAGGLSAHNLRREFGRIADVAQGPWWLDVETALRDPQDRFSPALAHAAVDAVLSARDALWM